jgi:hypothetical protein
MSPLPEAITQPGNAFQPAFQPAAGANAVSQGIPTAILPEGHPAKEKQKLVEYPRLQPIAVGPMHDDSGSGEGNLIVSRVFLEETNSYLYVAQTTSSVSMTIVPKPA